jgi:hypothetical protein
MSKQFSCEFCNYVSNRLYNLQRHTALHHDQSQTCVQQKVNVNNTTTFQCSSCYKNFKKAWCLKRHEPSSSSMSKVYEDIWK